MLPERPNSDKHGSGLRIYCEVPVLVTCNYTKHASLSDQFLTIRRWHGLALFWGHIRDLWLIRTTGTQCAAYMWYAPYALLIRSEEHTSELQSRGHLVCRLLLEKKKTTPR